MTKLIARTEDEGQVLHLTLDAPRGNVLDTEMMIELTVALLRARERDALKLVVLEGAGAHFSYGASIEEHVRERAAAMLATFRGVFEALLALSVPTLAVVRGQCLGGGAELAAFATWVYATPDARLGFPEGKLALFPPFAAVVLPWRLGGARAADLALTGRTVAADEALRLGLVDQVTSDPEAAWRQFAAEQLYPKSATSLRFAERAARRPLARAFAEDLPAIERMYVDELMATADANEGIRAFLEKRPPRFGPPLPR